MKPLEIISFATTLAIAAALPGPDVGVVVLNTLKNGIRSGLLTVVGLLVGHAVWITAAAVGLGLLLASYPFALQAAKIVGVAYIAYLAINLWQADGTETLQQTEAVRRSAIWAGIFVSLSNPKALIFYPAVVQGYVSVSGVSINSYTAMLISGHFS